MPFPRRILTNPLNEAGNPLHAINAAIDAAINAAINAVRNAANNPLTTLGELTLGGVNLLLRVLRVWRDGIRFPVGYVDVFIKPVGLTSEHLQFNVGLAAPVLPFPLTLGPVGPNINLVDRAFGPFQARVDFPRLSFEDGEIRADVPVMIRFQGD